MNFRFRCHVHRPLVGVLMVRMILLAFFVLQRRFTRQLGETATVLFPLVFVVFLVRHHFQDEDLLADKENSRDEPVLVAAITRGAACVAKWLDQTLQLRPEGFEPPTYGSEDHCSIQLSYGRNQLFAGYMPRAILRRQCMPASR
jgi:hypothetical protein